MIKPDFDGYKPDGTISGFQAIKSVGVHDPEATSWGVHVLDGGWDKVLWGRRYVRKHAALAMVTRLEKYYGVTARVRGA